MPRTLLLALVVLIGMGMVPVDAPQGETPALYYLSYEMQIRDIACLVETRGIAYRDDAVSSRGALGRCQVTPDAAKTVGYRGTNAELLTNGHTNRKVALAVILNCMSYGYYEPYRIAYCYHGGPNRRVRKGNLSHKYALEVAMIYHQTVAIPRMNKARNDVGALHPRMVKERNEQ